jgi:hypothetical protein
MSANWQSARTGSFANCNDTVMITTGAVILSAVHRDRHRVGAVSA